MSEHVITMYMPDRSEAADRALDDLRQALADADVGAPDETDTFEIRLDADDQEQALQKVWDAIALAGADDHIVFAEHPDLPEHWRTRGAAPGS